MSNELEHEKQAMAIAYGDWITWKENTGTTYKEFYRKNRERFLAAAIWFNAHLWPERDKP